MQRISTRLVISFLIVALLPAVPLSLVVRDLLERRFGPAIVTPLEQALEAGLDESRAHLRERRQGLAQRGAELTGDALILLDESGRVQPPDSLAACLASRPDLQAALDGLPVAERVERVADLLVLRRDDLTVLQPLPRGMVARAGDLTAGVSLLRVVTAEEDRVLSSFVGPFLLVYGVLILVALAAGVLWSRRMVRPLETLVGATRQVARGELDFRLERQGPGEVGELVASFDDMVGRLAEQRRDLARLERAAAWRGMARTLAHEVKNPLTPILMAVEQARDKYPGDDEQYRALLGEVAEIVGEEVESLRRLVREFGDFARLPKPVLVHGDLGAMLRDLEQLYGDGKLVLTGVENAGEGWFDAGALRRVLINLVDNGLAACREAGVTEKVSLAVSAGEPGVTLVVSDEGVGIPAANIDRVFEPDFTTKSEGMGLGLAVVQNIVVGHGGRIRVASVPGRGTAFTMELPLTAVGTFESEDQDGES